ncbi:MAG: hypothetical protein U0822_18715 [Anaerolineae bacterium]
MAINSAAASAKSTASSAMSAAGSATNSAVSAAGNAANSAVSASVSAVSSVSKPLHEPSRKAYGRLQESVQWYVEHWEDLVHEARAERAPHEEVSLSPDGILKSLSDAKVASDIPGRVRLRVDQLKGHDGLAEPVAQTLGSIPGVKQVEVSSATGSILVVYDKKKYASREELLGAIPAE